MLLCGSSSPLRYIVDEPGPFSSQGSFLRARRLVVTAAVAGGAEVQGSGWRSLARTPARLVISEGDAARASTDVYGSTGISIYAGTGIAGGIGGVGCSLGVNAEGSVQSEQADVLGGDQKDVALNLEATDTVPEPHRFCPSFLSHHNSRTMYAARYISYNSHIIRTDSTDDNSDVPEFTSGTRQACKSGVFCASGAFEGRIDSVRRSFRIFWMVQELRELHFTFELLSQMATLGSCLHLPRLRRLLRTLLNSI